MNLQDLLNQIKLGTEVLDTPLGSGEISHEPKQKKWPGNAELDLPEGWALDFEGERWVEFSVVDHVGDVKHDAYSIFTVRDKDDDGRSYEVIPYNPGKAWVRLSLGAKGGTTLTADLEGIQAGLRPFAQAGLSVFLPGDLDQRPADVARDIAPALFDRHAFSPTNALPVEGGLEVAFRGKLDFDITIDLSDLLAYGMSTLAKKGAKIIGFAPIKQEAGITAKVTATGGFLFQMGRLPDEGDRVCYRFRLTKESGTQRSYGVKVQWTGSANLDPVLDEFEEKLTEILGLNQSDGFFTQLENNAQKTLEAIGLKVDTKSKANAKAAEILKDLKSDLSEKMTKEVKAGVQLSFNRSSSQETLYQWKSSIPKTQAAWDPTLREALVSRDVAALHRQVNFLEGRCEAETYFVQSTETEGVNVGVGLQVGPWKVGSSNSREFSFTTTENRLENGGMHHAFDFSRGRIRSRAFETDAWEASLAGRPVTGQNAKPDEYDGQKYSLKALWQTDVDEDGGRRLKSKDIGELVDLLVLVNRGRLPANDDQEAFRKRLESRLQELEWLEYDGFAVVQIGIDDITSTQMMKLAKKIADLKNDQAQLEKLILAALPWDDGSHRNTHEVRTKLFKDYVSALFEGTNSLGEADRVLKKIAKNATDPMGADLSRELRNMTSMRISGQKGRQRRKLRYLAESLPAIAHDFDDTKTAIDTTCEAFADLEKKISGTRKIHPEELKKLMDQLFALPGTGKSFDFRLFLGMLAYASSKLECDSTIRNVSENQTMPIYMLT